MPNDLKILMIITVCIFILANVDRQVPHNHKNKHNHDLPKSDDKKEI